MPIKVIKLKDIELITCLTGASDYAIKFVCYDTVKSKSYNDYLTMTEFEQRVEKLNQRIKFTTNSVRDALMQDYPTEVEISEDSTLLKLKYKIEGAMRSLIWQWHLKDNDDAMFYRHVSLEALNTAATLNENVEQLMTIIAKKDAEIKQYRDQGTKLLRATLATQPFNVKAFQAEHKHMMMDVSKYVKAEQALGGFVPPFTDQTIAATATTTATTEPKSEIKNEKIERRNNVTRRSAINIPSKFEYKDSQSQSQEDDLDDNWQPFEKCRKTGN